ncbi:MAG: SpaH/EbpB family LPXTG-anchored major pilin [Gemmiger sp.]|uniref:SpaH/EbpB family LPXTG-anchored major pilin n=1 Tax=Gemmiger sp. TaxID=2049027 RepID=UPI002E7767F0|nr:SpaH/EbpB family LPXTG-anchored major pilin [Gemmiger sp.]MEE0709022.1 SpaH/EbpB family LPXTG-anchored major pilin [Gemmiger sp.]
MKKKLHRWAALCLTLALTFCLALPVWADEPEAQKITSATKGTITLTWDAGDTEGNTVTATAYQVISVNYDYDVDVPKNPEFTWVEAVRLWVNSGYSAYINGTDGFVTESFNNETVPAETMKAFADAMANAIRKGDISTQAAKTGTSSSDSLQLTDLDMGAYLILLEGGTKIYEPVFVSIVPTWNEGSSSWELNNLSQSATVKSQALTLTKTVYDKDNLTTPLTEDEYQAGIAGTSKYAQVSIGDTVTYMLVANVPDYPANATATGYQISDDLPSGMTLNNASVQVYGMATGSLNTEAGTLLTAGTGEAYTLTTTDATRPGTGTTSVDFNLEFDYSKIKNYDKIRVVYTATANSNIYVVGQNSNTTGNQNTAYLDYNNNPYEVTPISWKNAEDTATVYTYGIKVNKVDDEGQALSGAKFTLSANANGDTPIEFVGSNGTYCKATSDETGVTEIEVDSNGLLTLSGLDAGTYYLTETKAPGGYNKLSAPILVEIKDLKNGIADAEPKGSNGKPEYTLTTPDATETEATDGYVPLTVVNSKGFTLPSTGGMGTVLFTTIGIVLMGGGLVLLLLYLRRRNRTE